MSMPKQQFRTSRRGFLSLVAATAGCTTNLGASDSRVSVLAAGSLQQMLDSLQSRTDVQVEAEAMGSAAAIRLVDNGRRDPDILAVADTALFEESDWYARIGTNALTVAYTSETDGGQAMAAADRWFEPVLNGRATLGRTDPDLDPLGYRTLFMINLAAGYYDRPALSRKLLADDQIYPETGLLSQFETGGLDAAIVYRSMAVDRDYASLGLPPAVNLTAERFQSRYAEQTYTLPDGETIHGDVIQYGATIRNETKAARSVFETLVDGELLADHGFTVPERYPDYVGETPETLG